MPLAVFDAQLLATATAFAGATYLTWPEVPPITSNPEADCLGIVATSARFGRDLGLVVSHGLLAQVQAALADGVGLAQRDIDDYLLAVLTFARASGGGVMADPPLTGAAPPHVELPLQLAVRTGNLVVAGHPDLLTLGPRWGPQQTFVITPRELALRVDAVRRAG